ncbi:WYL domain-containing protein [Phytoactinopolyspora alkaliphila]|uniref:WYL domain-containing protein n=1 Tax=Phytoactinopolyspora alkaliphila TaxID=1783498 RepID=A0A6N9YGM3_9ACTN|nr:WYL domain-containing protein [Phytoactinopolyspora alkaliphila]NED94065.1 WYL domain-containing protein [Phytoactinopolyspora alkaliphila]
MVAANSANVLGHPWVRIRGNDSLEWLAGRMVVLGCDFEVHAPAELVAAMRTLADRAARAAARAQVDGSL